MQTLKDFLAFLSPILLGLVIVLLSNKEKPSTKLENAVLHDGFYYHLKYETNDEYIFEKITNDCIVTQKPKK